MRAIPGTTAQDSVLPTDVAPGDHDKPRIGRFRLDDLILGDRSAGLWRGFDERLKRMVSVRIVPASDPRQDQLRTAACLAARVVDRRVVGVLDVIDVDSTLVIVAEWIEGTNLEHLLTSDMTPTRSIAICREVGAAVQAIHDAGATHGRLRPASVVITSEGEVRVRGHCIDVALWGIAPGPDPHLADIYGIGALLMACLTRSWPGEPATTLRPAATFRNRYATPHQVRADVPNDLNYFVVRAMSAIPKASGWAVKDAFGTLAEARQALGMLADRALWTGVVPAVSVSPDPPTKHPKRQTKKAAKRGLGVLVATAVIATCAAIGGALLIPDGESGTSAQSAQPDRQAGRGTAIEPRALTIPGTTSDISASPTTKQIELERQLPIVGVSSLEPGDGLIKGENATYAIDENPATAWYTSIFPVHRPGRAQASGVIVDLGFPRSIRAIEVGLVGNNTDFEIRMGDRRSRSISDYKLIDTVEGAPGFTTVRQPRATTARYVLVLLTGVPSAFDGFRGGVAAIQVRGD